MKNWSMRIFSVLCLLMLSGAAFADSSVGSAVSNHTDLSVSFLGQIFGNVGNSLQGTSGQMLGMLFYKFNQGILVVAGFWLSYLVFTTFLKSAHEGSFIAPNRNIVLILLRVALGFGLLLPNPVTGYSIFQDVLMKVVVAGVSLADDTWSYGLNYINNGGSVWTNPNAAGHGTTAVTWTQWSSIIGNGKFGPNSGTQTPSFNDLGIGQKIFISEVCMYASQYANPQGSQANNVIEDDKNNKFIFPGITSGTGSGAAGSDCGSVTWTNFINSQNATNTGDFTKQGVIALVYDLLPAAKQYVCLDHPDASGCSGTSTDPTTDIGNEFFNAGIAYVNAVFPLTQMAGDAASRQLAFIDTAKTQGWMMSGRYYWDLSQAVSGFNKKKDITSYLPMVIEPGLMKSNNNKIVSDTMSNALGSIANYTGAANQVLFNYQQTGNAGDPSQNGGFQEPSGDWDRPSLDNMPGVLAAVLWPYMDGLDGIIANFGNQPGSGFSSDPIVLLHNIGMRCLSLAGAMWLTTGIIIMTMSAVTIFCQAMVNAFDVFNTIVSWIKPFMMMMAAALLAVGVLLGFYVPLYPYLLFTFGVIGWIIRVLVAMAAAPLVCLSLTHPEGHDFMGKAEQALMLLLSVFIEPVLMVIGLFAGMILSYVSLRIIIYTFSGFLSDLFSTTGANSGVSPDLVHSAMQAAANYQGTNMGGPVLVGLAFPIFLIVFSVIVYTVTNKCFSTIYELPSAVMDWIGGPKFQSTSGQMAEAVSGALGQVGSRMPQGMSVEGKNHKFPQSKSTPNTNIDVVDPNKK